MSTCLSEEGRSVGIWGFGFWVLGLDFGILAFWLASWTFWKVTGTIDQHKFWPYMVLAKLGLATLGLAKHGHSPDGHSSSVVKVWRMPSR